MGLPRDKRKLLDEEELFNKYYVEGGPGYSFNKLHEWVKRTHGLNPETHKPFSMGGLIQAVNRHLYKNYADPQVKNAFLKYYIDYGLDPLTDDEYLHEVSKRAKGIMKETQYRNFIKNNSDLEYIE